MIAMKQESDMPENCLNTAGSRASQILTTLIVPETNTWAVMLPCSTYLNMWVVSHVVTIGIAQQPSAFTRPRTKSEKQNVGEALGSKG